RAAEAHPAVERREERAGRAREPGGGRGVRAGRAHRLGARAVDRRGRGLRRGDRRARGAAPPAGGAAGCDRGGGRERYWTAGAALSDRARLKLGPFWWAT